MSEHRRTRSADSEGKRNSGHPHVGSHDPLGVFDRVFEASSDAMKLIDLDGRIMRWNGAAHALYGWTEDEVRGLKMPHVAPPDRRRAIADLRAVAASGEVVTRSTLVMRKDGSSISVALSLIPFLDEDGNPAGVVSVGAESRASVDAATYPDDYCLAFAQALRPPLTALAGYAQLLLQPDIVDDLTRRVRIIRAIEEHTAHVSSLLDDTAMIVEVRTGAADARTREVDVVAVVTDAVHRVEQVRSGPRLVIDFVPGLPPARSDRARLERVLTGLVGLSADRAMEGGNVAVTVDEHTPHIVVHIAARHRPKGTAPGSAAQIRDVDTLQWHNARLFAERCGGALVRSVGRDGSVAYRMMLPVATPTGQR